MTDLMAKRAARLLKEAGTLGDLEAGNPLDFRNPEPDDLAKQIEAARFKLRAEGREAFEGGLPAESCPYPYADKPHARREWINGYNNAAALNAEPVEDEPEDDGDDDNDDQAKD